MIVNRYLDNMGAGAAAVTDSLLATFGSFVGLFLSCFLLRALNLLGF